MQRRSPPASYPESGQNPASGKDPASGKSSFRRRALRDGWPLVACALASGAAGALAIELWRSSPGADSAALAGSAGSALRQDAAEGPAAAIATLRSELREEREARGRIQAQVALLERALRELTGGDVPASDLAMAGEAPEGRPAAPASEGESAPALVSPWPRRPWFDSQSLVDAGLGDSEVARLQTKWEEAELEKLYLRDEAARNGRPYSRQGVREVDASLREELGEDGYDWMLFATGQGNRVVVGDVLARSPAEDAGFRPNDVVLRYDGARVYATGELQRATSAGDPGERVYVDVLREGVPRSIVVPRGPLGLRLQQERRPPETS